MIVLGHRGGRDTSSAPVVRWPPENSLAAFTRAFAEGADGVELDVRLCASGEPVLVHDPSLAGVTGGRDRRPVHGVRRVDLPTVDGSPIPDLAAALEACRGRIVNVEVKPDVPRRLTLAHVVARTVARGPRDVEVVLSSFDPVIVAALAAFAPRVARAMLVGPRTPRLAVAMPRALRSLIVAAHLDDALVSADRVARLHRAGLRVVAWTVNDPARAVCLAEMGVDGMISDEPASVLAALSGRR